MKRKVPQEFKPPTDIHQWWLSPHCGPGTLDINDVCGFCGDTHEECAKSWSDTCKKDPTVRECGDTCGGSGLWCSSCGRFWTQNSCGENFGTELQSCDGAELTQEGEQIHCCCGKALFREMQPG